jgi:zinc protease
MVKHSIRWRLGLFVLSLVAGAWTAAGLEAGQLDYQEIALDNGLRVITLEDFSCPIVAVDLWYHVGSKDENPERQGFAHMFEHMMFRGTDRLGPTDHFDYIRQIGGRCNGYTSFDQTVYVQTVPANQLELVLWLEAERMSFLKIDQAAFDTERKVVEEERRLGLNAPYGTLEEKALAEIFKVHPYRWTPIGKIPHLRAASVPELRAFWTQYYTPNDATLVIAGAVKHQEAQALAKRYFGWIPRYADPPRVPIHEPMPEQPREVTLKLENAPAPLVGIAYRTVPVAHDDHVPIELLSTILGGGNSSRAYRDLVAKKELAVGVQCMDFLWEQDGVFAFGAAFVPSGGRLDAALAALRKEIDQVRTKKVKPRELEKAKNQMLSGLVTENLYVSNKASILGHAAVIEGDTARVNRRLDAIRKVTADDLLRVAKAYLDPNRSLTFRVERNLLGMLGKKKNPEDEAPVTGQPETNPPAPGRPGETRPADYPAAPPLKGLLDFDPTEHYQTRTLGNGLKVVVVENHEVPFVAIWLGLRAGAWTEAKPGCASMALSMLRKGTRRHTEGELADELETYAIGLYGWAGMDNATVSASCLTDQVERAARLMAEIVLMPAFNPREFEKLRKQVVTGLAIAAAEPSYLAGRELRRHIYGGHPYARTVQGEVKDVTALQPQDLKAWWSTFARPDMACLYFSGDINLDRAVQLAEAAFGSWKAKGPKPETQVPPIPEPAPTHIYLVDKPGDQSQIRIAQRGITRGHPGYFTSRVVNGYFGGAFGSRLNESLRVKKGLTYGAGGGYSTQRMAGEFDVSTFTKIESTPDAVQAALDEIKRLQAEPPTPKELDQTKAYIVGSFAGNRETPQSIAGDLWLIESEGLPQDYFRRLLKGVQATDPGACAQLAQGTLDPAKLVIVVVGPAIDLKPKLEAIAPVTVVPLG